jgi:hypothetical protein
VDSAVPDPRHHRDLFIDKVESMTLMEDCFAPHTNTADSGMPHESLVEYIAQLEHERDAYRAQLTATLRERLILGEKLQILRSAAT